MSKRWLVVGAAVVACVTGCVILGALASAHQQLQIAKSDAAEAWGQVAQFKRLYHSCQNSSEATNVTLYRSMHNIRHAKDQIRELLRMKEILMGRVAELEGQSKRQLEALNTVTADSNRVQHATTANDPHLDTEDIVEPFAFTADQPPDFDDVTITTQLSTDRLSRLAIMANVWRGPISAAVLTHDSAAEMIQTLRNSDSAVSSFVDFHLVTVANASRGYPVNMLRNVAVRHTRSNFVLGLDVDLVPCEDCREKINAAAKLHLTDGLGALVVPCFELNVTSYCLPVARFQGSSCRPGALMPLRSKPDMVQLINQKLAFPTHWFKTAAAQGATNYPRWLKATRPYRTRYELFYEPYFVARKPIIPFDERFVGYGCDKLSQTMEMEAAMYDWLVIPDAYTVHLDHKEANWRRHMNLTVVTERFWQFAAEIQEKYGFPIPVPHEYGGWKNDYVRYFEFFNADGKPYYFDQKTNETFWELPGPLQAKHSAQEERKRMMAKLELESHPMTN